MTISVKSPLSLLFSNQPALEPIHSSISPKTFSGYTTTPNRTGIDLQRSNRLEELIEHLEKAGFRRLPKNNIKGQRAIVLESNEHQMIRIVSANCGEVERSKNDYMLQPIATIDTMPGYRIEILPRVNTLADILSNWNVAKEYGFEPESGDSRFRAPSLERIARKFTEALITDVWKDGGAFIDPHVGNVGIIINSKGENIPVIIDPGAVDMNYQKGKGDVKDKYTDLLYHYVSEGYLGKIKDYDSKNNVSDEELQRRQHLSVDDTEAEEKIRVKHRLAEIVDLPSTLTDYKQAQKDYLDILNLKAGAPNGVVSDADLSYIYGDKPHGMYASLAKENGFYEDEIRKIVAEAVATYDDNAGYGFGEHVKNVLAERANATTGNSVT